MSKVYVLIEEEKVMTAEGTWKTVEIFNGVYEDIHSGIAAASAISTSLIGTVKYKLYKIECHSQARILLGESD